MADDVVPTRIPMRSVRANRDAESPLLGDDRLGDIGQERDPLTETDQPPELRVRRTIIADEHHQSRAVFHADHQPLGDRERSPELGGVTARPLDPVFDALEESGRGHMGQDARQLGVEKVGETEVSHRVANPPPRGRKPVRDPAILQIRPGTKVVVEVTSTLELPVVVDEVVARHLQHNEIRA